MEQLASPCISICQIHPETGHCSGCYRTREEIAKWRSLAPADQAALLKELGIRRAAETGVKRRETRRRKS
ncbi:MAG: DUF1289 domain-containing protein [Candidatus Puniceispirillaceae bacterium]